MRDASITLYDKVLPFSRHVHAGSIHVLDERGKAQDADLRKNVSQQGSTHHRAGQIGRLSLVLPNREGPLVDIKRQIGYGLSRDDT